MSDGYETMIGYWIWEGFDAPYPVDIEQPWPDWACLWEPPGVE